MGGTAYLSLLKVVNGVIGNSSSGIYEAPFFGIRTINIGDRQHGRFMPSSIINCPVSKNKIYIFCSFKYFKEKNNIQTGNFFYPIHKQKIFLKMKTFSKKSKIKTNRFLDLEVEK